jgi:hypothetical protein
MTGCRNLKSIKRKRLRIYSIYVVLAFVTLWAAGCAGPLFNVKPVVELPPLAGNVKTANAGGVTLRVAPPLLDEESQELFDANLPLSGVVALRVELAYSGDAPVELKKVRFRMHDDQGREFKLLSPKQTISRLMKANDITLYNPHSRKQTEADFAAYALDLKTPLAVSDRRQGFLFFQTPKHEPLTNPKGLVLQLDYLQQPLEIVLN